MAHITVVDDEEGFTSGIADYLRKRDHEVSTAGSLADARALTSQRLPDVLLLDLMLPDGNGLDLLAEMDSQRPRQVILITGHGGIKNLIGDMAGEGVTYLRKPVSPRELLEVVNSLDLSGESPAATGADEVGFGAFIGESDLMKNVFEQIEKIAPSNTTVFVQGESGTGKELVAESVHRLSGRAGAFVPVNCGGLAKDLLSAQLFGHEKGSFTGAQKRHKGFFERASGGTLFLDEVTEMPLEMQTHLLRVLETGKVLRVGAEREIKVDCRLIVATNRNPAQAVREGALREDLYFRLMVFPITLPPLRHRGNDVALLAQHFLDRHNELHGTSKRFAEGALETLAAHSWPGNVRELKHTIHRCYLHAEGDQVKAIIEDEVELTSGVEGVTAGRSIADVEKDLILKTLDYFNGDKKAAAESLGVSTKTLYNRLHQYADADSDTGS